MLFDSLLFVNKLICSLYYFQVNHLRTFIKFRFVMGFGDNIIAKCKYKPKITKLILKLVYPFQERIKNGKQLSMIFHLQLMK